jgi:RNA polymerase sigma-70 factor (ECF subfamily)
MPERAAPSDRDLVETARGNDDRAEEAFLLLYDRYKAEVFSFLAKITGDRALAEDALQEAFFRVHESLERFDLDRPFRSWLYQIARHAAIEGIRSKKKAGRLADEAAKRAPPATPDVLTGVMKAEEHARAEARQARVASALDSLPDETRALLVQRHALGMKLEDLAESWSCTERTIRNRLKSGATALARVLFALEFQEGGGS